MAVTQSNKFDRQTGYFRLPYPCHFRAEGNQITLAIKHSVHSLTGALAFRVDAPGVCRAVLATLMSNLKASLTASDVGNAVATSGESTIRLLPLASRSTYFPRTPWLKSYSAINSGSCSADGVFFIAFPFLRCRDSGADQSDAVATVGMDNHQHTSLERFPDMERRVRCRLHSAPINSSVDTSA